MFELIPTPPSIILLGGVVRFVLTCLNKGQLWSVSSLGRVLSALKAAGEQRKARHDLRQAGFTLAPGHRELASAHA
jgi:hypothetical protein